LVAVPLGTPGPAGPGGANASAYTAEACRSRAYPGLIVRTACRRHSSESSPLAAVSASPAAAPCSGHGQREREPACLPELSCRRSPPVPSGQCQQRILAWEEAEARVRQALRAHSQWLPCQCPLSNVREHEASAQGDAGTCTGSARRTAACPPALPDKPPTTGPPSFTPAVSETSAAGAGTTQRASRQSTARRKAMSDNAR